MFVPGSSLELIFGTSVRIYLHGRKAFPDRNSKFTISIRPPHRASNRRHTLKTRSEGGAARMVYVTIWHSLSIEYEGRTIQGSYAFLPDERIIHVKTRKGEKVTWLEGSSPLNTARLLLLEMAREGEA